MMRRDHIIIAKLQEFSKENGRNEFTNKTIKFPKRNYTSIFISIHIVEIHNFIKIIWKGKKTKSLKLSISFNLFDCVNARLSYKLRSTKVQFIYSCKQRHIKSIDEIQFFAIHVMNWTTTTFWTQYFKTESQRNHYNELRRFGSHTQDEPIADQTEFRSVWIVILDLVQQ